MRTAKDPAAGFCVKIYNYEYNFNCVRKIFLKNCRRFHYKKTGVGG